MKCTNCGNATFKSGFLTGDRGLLYYQEGKPSLGKQLFGKKKKLAVKICSRCGHCDIFAK